jgi:(S)-ureidoglycine aminohydrolase
MTYYVPRGGLPPQTALTTDRARFTEAYAVIPARTLSDITTSYLPHWDRTRMWVLARPLTGEGSPTLTVDGTEHALSPGSYAFLPPGTAWTFRNGTDATATFHWIRKAYQRADGVEVPEAFVTQEQDITPLPMPGTDGAWTTTRFVDIADLRHDLHVNIVNFEPGGAIPFPETHVMEHGLYVLEGKAVYLLNEDWVEVEAGDFMWLRAFCPQACYAGGPGRFRYLLYKDVNRHVGLTL